MAGPAKIGPETALTLDQFAAILRVHPRTVLRRLAGDRTASLKRNSPYWAEGYNPKYPIEQVAREFRVQPDRVVSLVRGADALWTLREAAGELRLRKDTFSKRRYPCLVHSGGVVRYSRHDVMRWHAEHWTRDD